MKDTKTQIENLKWIIFQWMVDKLHKINWCKRETYVSKSKKYVYKDKIKNLQLGPIEKKVLEV